ncbi:hypothetical protein [Microbacterium sp. NPDC089696]
MRADQVTGPVRLPELAPSPLLRGWALVALLTGLLASALGVVGMVVS